MTTPITDVIPPGRKCLIKTLEDAGFSTLEACGGHGDKLRKLKGVGKLTIVALKEHCFKRGIMWFEYIPYVYATEAEMAVHFMSRYKLDRKEAELVAKIFFWDNASSSSMRKPIF